MATSEQGYGKDTGNKRKNKGWTGHACIAATKRVGNRLQALKFEQSGHN